VTRDGLRVLALLAAFGCNPDDPVSLGDSGSTAPTTPGTPTDQVDPTVPRVLSSTPCDACAGDCVVEQLAYPDAYHDPLPIEYADLPPAGGPHNPCWASFGVHDAAVDDDRWVHNLEHGGIVLLHDCAAAGGCPEDAASLSTVVQDRPFVLVTPYSGLERPFAAIGWEVRMLTGCVDLDAFVTFHDDHVDRAPESVPSGPPDDCM
jgi:hypothetical protein